MEEAAGFAFFLRRGALGILRISVSVRESGSRESGRALFAAPAPSAHQTDRGSICIAREAAKVRYPAAASDRSSDSAPA